MASYGGHALPGIIFLIFGFWINIRESLSSLSTRHSHRHFLRKDGIIILCAVALGSFVELFWPWNGNHPPFGRLRDPVNPELFFKPMNWQHFTMYLFFGIYGCTRLLENRSIERSACFFHRGLSISKSRARPLRNRQTHSHPHRRHLLRLGIIFSRFILHQLPAEALSHRHGDRHSNFCARNLVHSCC